MERPSAPTEASPLLGGGAASTSPKKVLESRENGSSVSILVDIVGARWLPIEDMDTYCVVQYGSKTVHQTKAFAPQVSRASKISRALNINRLFGKQTTSSDLLQKSLQNPVWTIEEKSLFSITVTNKDYANKKPLVITLWALPRPVKLRQHAADLVSPKLSKPRSSQAVFVGKIRIPSTQIWAQASSHGEQRKDYPLVDELGRGIPRTNSWDDDVPVLAMRFRVAAKADCNFVEYWNHHPRPLRLFRLIQLGDLKVDWQRPTAKLMTELPEHQVVKTVANKAVTASIASYNNKMKASGQILVKPYPDPTKTKTENYLTASQLKEYTQLPSKKWIQAGSKATSLGRVYLEFLSCRNLLNARGTKVGNQTNAFCAAICGDAMVQTDVIEAEPSPHWMPWTQRAFVLEFQHPSQVLFISVFGYKRTPLAHRPIGRVEINPMRLQVNTLYNLEYDLFRISSETQQQEQPRGRLRIRLRLEIDNERKALLAALRPPPSVVLNVRQKKSLPVARYTARGEYDDNNPTKFRRKLLQSYVDEILEGYLRRLLYGVQDGCLSLFLWRDQVHFGEFGFPIYSLLAFMLGTVAIEHPRFIPGILCFSLALFMIAQLQQRINSPSPWQRCFPLSHYLRILIVGKSSPSFQSIDVNEGWPEHQKRINELKKRIREDHEFFERKEAVEKEIEELENDDEDATSVPLEMLIVLGKVQAIVGDVCRLCRSVDAIITWEESFLAFFLTSALVVVGFVLLFLPWSFLWTWLGRIVVVLLLGPQNRVVDILWYQDRLNTDQRIYQLFSYRMFHARCQQETAGKLRTFRHLLFGKFATRVPSIIVTKNRDCPLPMSTAKSGPATMPGPNRQSKLPVITGQLLQGNMIPRPREAWVRNEDESKRTIEGAQASISDLMNSSDQAIVLADSKIEKDAQPSTEGFEVTEIYDEEAGYVHDVLTPAPEESIRELGVEVLDSSAGSTRYIPAWRSASLHSLPDLSQETSGGDINREPGRLEEGLPDGPILLSELDREAMYGQSTIELGVEVDDIVAGLVFPDPDDHAENLASDDSLVDARGDRATPAEDKFATPNRSSGLQRETGTSPEIESAYPSLDVSKDDHNIPAVIPIHSSLPKPETLRGQSPDESVSHSLVFSAPTGSKNLPVDNLCQAGSERSASPSLVRTRKPVPSALIPEKEGDAIYGQSTTEPLSKKVEIVRYTEYNTSSSYGIDCTMTEQQKSSGRDDGTIDNKPLNSNKPKHVPRGNNLATCLTKDGDDVSTQAHSGSSPPPIANSSMSGEPARLQWKARRIEDWEDETLAATAHSEQTLKQDAPPGARGSLSHSLNKADASSDGSPGSAHDYASAEDIGKSGAVIEHEPTTGSDMGGQNVTLVQEGSQEMGFEVSDLGGA